MALSDSERNVHCFYSDQAEGQICFCYNNDVVSPMNGTRCTGKLSCHLPDINIYLQAASSVDLVIFWLPDCVFLSLVIIVCLKNKICLVD